MDSAITYLNCTELFVNDLDHALDLFGGDGPGATLFPQQVHDVGGEFVASLLVLLHLLLVDGPDLSQLVLVVSVLDRSAVIGQGRGGRGAALVGTFEAKKCFVWVILKKRSKYAKIFWTTSRAKN